MGHIAEALKKAQRERSERLRMNLGDKSPVEERRAVGRRSEDFSGVRAILATGPATQSLCGQLETPPGTGDAPWDIHPSLVAHTEKMSSVAEQYRAVRTWLLSRARSHDRPCLAITSTMPQEGKTVTTANLAIIMSEVRQMRVLAVDCDLREGRLASLFKITQGPGLAEVLAGDVRLAEAIRPTPIPNLFLLTAGTRGATNPTELLNSTAAARVFDEIRERYHYSLVDTPPVQRVSDVGVIGALCTGVLMLVRMQRTPANLARQALHWLQSNNLNVVGCIATACSMKAATYTYRSYEKEP